MKFKTFYIHPCAKFSPGISEPERSDSFSTCGAGRERVSFQIVVEAFKDITGLCVRIEPFRSDADKFTQIDPANMKMYTVESIYMDGHTEKNDNLISQEPGMYPDPLRKTGAINMKSGEFHDLLVITDIPENTPAGEYTAQVVISSSAADKAVMTPKLKVFGFNLADSDLDIIRWLHVKNIERVHGAAPGSEKFFMAVERLAELLKEYGETMVYLPWTDLHIISRDEDGAISIDSWITRKMIAIFKEYGFKKFVFKHIGWRDQWVTDYMLGFSIKTHYQGRVQFTKICDFFDPGYQKILQAHLEEIQSIAEADTDCCEFYTHVFDEPLKPHLEILRKTIDILHETCPSIKTLEAMRGNDLESYDMMDVCVSLFDSDLDMKAKIHGEFFWYICMDPRGSFPNRFIDQNPACYRVVPWLLWMYGIKGYLEWAFNFYGEGSWNNILTDFDPSRNAFAASESYDPKGFVLSPSDAFLVYPDKDVFYTPSLRLEIFKKGLEEYRYLKMIGALADAGVPGAREISDEMKAFLGDTLKYSLKIEDYDGMKTRMAEFIAANSPEVGL